MQIRSLTPEQALAGRCLVVDVRSTLEFAEGHVPGAVNHPFLDDEQRAQVGTAYKQRGAQEARMVAVKMVSPGLPGYLAVLRDLARDRPLAIMCWRGGERSRNVVLLLALVGVHAARVEGGYKAYRALVREELASWRPELRTFTLYGYTGAGKTGLLAALARLGSQLPRPRPAVLDLEGLALHRGSFLGGLNQPGERNQKTFESLLFDGVRNLDGDYLLFEGEGAKIGRLSLPAGVATAVREATPLHVTASVGQRTERILAEYAPGSWTREDRERFQQGLDLIGSRLSGDRVRSLRVAFEDARFGDVVRDLLLDYYDPLYHRSSVAGREFLLTFETGDDPDLDARRFAAEMRLLLQNREIAAHA